MQTHFLDGFESGVRQGQHQLAIDTFLAKLGGLISRTHTF